MPKPSGPLRASPDSLTTTRRRDGVTGSLAESLAMSLPVPTGAGPRLFRVAFRLLDALAQRVAHEAGDLDRAAHLALGFLERLGHGLRRIEDEALIEQADLLVVGLQARFDDLVDDIRGFPLLLVLVDQHVLLALHHVRIEA